MDRNDLIGGTQVAGGVYLGYKGIEHGLPRATGIRIEYHTTSKQNADLIKKSGNILDPAFGGKNGWSEKIGFSMFTKNSQNYVHITGLHANADLKKFFKSKKIPNFLVPMFRTYYRKFQNLMYRTVGNCPNIAEILKMSKDEKAKKRFSYIKNAITGRQTKRFCIPGIDSYFNKNFITDTDDIALKSAKPIKAYNNRFSAMAAGLKEFGFKGMKENKGRVAFGVSLIALGVYAGAKLIGKGLNNIKNDCRS